MEIVDVLENSMKNKDLRVLAIEGNGSSFCSGDDLKSMGPEGVRFKPLEDGSELPHQRMLYLIREIQKPVVALLHGFCLGAGFELALACDIRLAADNLRIGDHRASRAICVLCGASWLLPRIIGFGRHLDAKEALDIGLISKVYPETEFKEKTKEYLKDIAKLPTRCLGYNKTMLNFSQINEMIPSLHHEFKLYCKNIRTHDFGEGMKSFMKKRNPKFLGK
jgi:2-(1,2-epoxy-1,2-dihydrophenyl)acetyl-CoA isomerase